MKRCLSSAAFPSRRAFLHGAATVTFAGPMHRAAEAASASTLAPPPGVRVGELTVRGQTIEYKAEAGETPLRLGNGEIGGTIFSVAYVGRSVSRAPRPVTFVWNGGPGGSTYPLRTEIAPRIFERAATPRGFDYIDNFNSLIDVTDLVFVDAPGTGYSRVFSEAGKREFWGVEEDGRAFAQFIRNWLARHKRENAPLFLLGESYGGTRIGQVARCLAKESARPIYLSGAIFISPTMHGTGDQLSIAKPSGAQLCLPTQAATAWYHRKGEHAARSLAEVTALAETFAMGPYADAIERGADITAENWEDVARATAGFIGLPVEVVRANGLAVPSDQFRDLLLADRNARLDSYDGRSWRLKPPPGAAVSHLTTAEGYDLHAALVGLIAEDLNYRTSAAYRRDPTEIGDRWSLKTRDTISTPEILAGLMAEDARLQLLLLGGYFDFAVPYKYQIEALSENDLPEQRVRSRVFPVGHPVFDDKSERVETTDFVREFYSSIANGGSRIG